MKLKKITLAAAMLLPLSVIANAEELSKAELERLQAELAETRIELAETARRMSEIQRQLLTEEMELHEQAIRIEIENGEIIRDEQIVIDDLNLSDLAGDHERFEFKFNNVGISPPRLGIVLDNSSGEDAFSVLAVTPGSGAADAGMEQGDIIISVDGQSVEPGTGVSIGSVMSELEVGDTVPVEIERNGERMVLDITTTSAGSFNISNVLSNIDWNDTEQTVRRAIRLSSKDGEIVDFLGDLGSLGGLSQTFFSVNSLGLGRGTELISNHAGLTPYFGTDEGVVVLRIDDDNPLNIQSGDVILRVDQQPVSRPVELGPIIIEQVRDGDTIDMEVMRNGVLTQIQAEATSLQSGMPMRFDLKRFIADPAEPPSPPAPPERPLGLHF